MEKVWHAEYVAQCLNESGCRERRESLTVFGE